MGTMIKNEIVAATPATSTFDFNTVTQLTGVGPFWVSLNGWTDTPDAAAGVMVITMDHVDSSGVSRDVNFDTTTNIVLADGTAYFQTGVVCVTRQSGSSAWNLQLVLSGLAGTAKYSYTIVVSPNDETEPLPFGF